MAKIALSKLGLNNIHCWRNEPQTIEWFDQSITVTRYLPVAQKLELISRVINNSIDDNGYYNPARIEVNLLVEIILAYTNISVTEKQREDIGKLYDLFVSSAFADKVYKCLEGTDEVELLTKWSKDMIHSIYEYKNSVCGILDTISSDYNNLNLDANDIAEKLGDKENLSFLREVLSKLD